MKYNIGDTISINNKEWVISEHRMARGREWMYLLSHEDINGSYITMSLNERAMDGLAKTGALIGSVDEIQK